MSGAGAGEQLPPPEQLPPYSDSSTTTTNTPNNPNNASLSSTNQSQSVSVTIPINNPNPIGTDTTNGAAAPPAGAGARQDHQQQQQQSTTTRTTRHFPFSLSFLINRQGRRRSHSSSSHNNSFPRMMSHRSAFTYTCFSCLHVRTMTILIGVWYLMLYILALSFMTALLMYHKPDGDSSFGPNTIVTNPVAMTTKHNGNSVNIPPLDSLKIELGLETVDKNNGGGQGTLDEKMNIGIANGDPEPKETSMDTYSPTYTNGNHRTNSQFLLLTFCNLLITLLLLYGTLRSKPSYLMPFFILKVFEFCIYCLSMIGLLSYLPNIGNHIIQMQGDSSSSPSANLLTPLLTLPPPILSLLTFLFIISSVVIKAYVLNVVWNCYKYLMVRNSMIGVPGSGRWDIRGSQRDSVQFGRGRGLRRLNSFDQWLEDYINNHRNGNNAGAQNNLTATVDLPDYDTAVSDPRYARKPAEGTTVAGEGGVPTVRGTENQRTQVWAPVPPPPEYSQI